VAYSNDIDLVGRINQTAGSIFTTVNGVGSGDIELRADTGINIVGLTSNRLQASNARLGNIDILAQAAGGGVLELADIDTLGYAVRNSRAASRRAPSTACPCPERLADGQHVRERGRVRGGQHHPARRRQRRRLGLHPGQRLPHRHRGDHQPQRGELPEQPARHPWANGDNSVFFTGVPCVISYGPASYVRVAADNDPTTDLDIVLTQVDFPVGGPVYPLRVVLIAEGSIVLDGAIVRSNLGVIAIADWRFSDPNNVGGIYTVNSGMFVSNDFQFQAGAAPTNLTILTNQLGYEGPAAAPWGVLGNGNSINVATRALNQALSSTFQVEVRTVPITIYSPNPIPQSDVIIDHQGSATIRNGGIVFEACLKASSTRSARSPSRPAT